MEGEIDGVIIYLAVTATLTGTGIYCLRRGKKPRDLEKTRQIAASREWAKSIFGVPNKEALECPIRFKPSIKIEPNQVVWSRQKGKPEEIEKAREVLVSIAENIEKY